MTRAITLLIGETWRETKLDSSRKGSFAKAKGALEFSIIPSILFIVKPRCFVHETGGFKVQGLVRSETVTFAKSSKLCSGLDRFVERTRIESCRAKCTILKIPDWRKKRSYLDAEMLTMDRIQWKRSLRGRKEVEVIVI